MNVKEETKETSAMASIKVVVEINMKCCDFTKHTLLPRKFCSPWPELQDSANVALALAKRGGFSR